MTPLPPSFFAAPIAHRAFHDVKNGRPENSRAAIEAAVERGYGIEIDLQLSKDRQAMVFHDYDLARLADATGPIQQRSADELGAIGLRGGNEGIPSFDEVLALVAGRVPLLVEIKDQDGAMGPRTGQLEQAAAQCLEHYRGDVAIMSFNPHAIAEFAKHRRDLPLGLVTCAYLQEDWPLLPAATRHHLRDIPDFDRVGADFISHDVNDLTNPAVRRLKDRGLPVLCWTVRSQEVEKTARQIADNVTFEGYEA
ncbi:glycerophosphodiester phosphodiesterase family protein [Aliiroseovarius crassostreae]|uniref:glycerophosphodiester phosphodiesterase family protein n=1 Tax=Aliiroseovarius crassostreae TaxID=154981 RepID=UPI0021AE6197|nr:glycerophosphodiester phosphodiesterase family protein [Aliiroseovarius crassostreae]UWP98047.1 phosphodiesterase [Aliiroseovarius crassostreae]